MGMELWGGNCYLSHRLASCHEDKACYTQHSLAFRPLLSTKNVGIFLTTPPHRWKWNNNVHPVFAAYAISRQGSQLQREP